MTDFIDPNTAIRGRTWDLLAEGAGSLIELTSLVNLQDVSSADWTSLTSSQEGMSSLTVRSGGRMQANGAFANLSNIGIHLETDGMLAGDFEVREDSVVRGSGGSVTGSLRNRAVVSPGYSAGSLTVTGDYAQLLDGTLRIELGGRGAGLSFDQLIVGGTVSLNGTLSLSLIDDFSPSIGDTFDVLTYGSVTGAFAEIEGSDLGDGKTLSPTYEANSFTLTTTEPLMLGTQTGYYCEESQTLDQTTARVAFDAVIAEYVAAGLSQEFFSDLRLLIEDLPGKQLGAATTTTVWLDVDAAGSGWFTEQLVPVEVTDADLHNEAASRVDLMTVVRHELGHALGLSHHQDSGHFMHETLEPGVQKKLSTSVLDEVFANMERDLMF